MSKNIFLFEINEFNYDLMKSMSEELELDGLKQILKYKHSILTIPDAYESDFLEPWSQWVSVHTGTSSDQHKIKHLGDIPQLQQKQLWEAVSDQNIKVGVWGVMNGDRAQAKNCLFFMPDPWSFTELGYPEKVAALLKLPRYIAKNYLKLNIVEIFKLIPSFIQGLSLVPLKLSLLAELITTLFNAVKYKNAHFVWISFFDYLTTHAFISLVKRNKTEFNIFFINSIAHAQHHYWSDSKNTRLKYTYKVLDKIVGLLLSENILNQTSVITNGLTQKNTNTEDPWILYRQKDPKLFFQKLNLGVTAVESLMTHDIHLFFNSAEEKLQAFKVLNSARIDDKKLFFVELDSADPKKLFVRLDFFNATDKNSNVQIGTYSFLFFEEFKEIVTRTGKHIQRADVISDLVEFKETTENYKLYHRLVAEVSK